MDTLVDRYSMIINYNNACKMIQSVRFLYLYRRISIEKTHERRFIKCYLSISKWQISNTKHCETIYRPKKRFIYAKSVVLLRRNIAPETQKKLLLRRNITPLKIQPCLNGEYS